MTAKFDEFIQELEKLCVSHKVLLEGDDLGILRIYDLKTGEHFLNGYIEDRTKELK